ncbi:MAG: hypothetical protein DWQ07_11870 [Chloroflexi bacterium]|nr:MAG: hypothetical protein DWQ07_11870 [Chloroflexota bacterium]MBL1196056.1 hypothetical protein [Chloroflexota bacterium]NOH13350.1 hypothetical protein [Chloroflexota bacterium]
MVIETLLSKRLYVILSLAILILGACSSASATEQPTSTAAVVEDAVTASPTDEIANIAPVQKKMTLNSGIPTNRPTAIAMLRGLVRSSQKIIST